MSKVTVNIEIKAPREEVFATMLDPARLQDWVTIHRKVNSTDPGAPREGFCMVQTLALRGAHFKVKWTLTHFDHPYEATWEGRGPGHSYAKTAYRLTENGKSTHFEYFNEYKAPGGMFGAAASRALVGGTSEKEAKRSLERLKALLER